MESKEEKSRAYLDIARPAIEVEVQVFDLSVVGELVHDILLCRLLVDIGYENDPPFNGCVGENDEGEFRR